MMRPSKDLTCVFALALLTLLTGMKTTRAQSFDDIDYGLTTSRISLDGSLLNYYDSGSGGDVVLLIHGLGSNLSFWRENIPALQPSHRVLAIDLPGHGKSDKEGVDVAIPSIATRLHEFLQALGVTRAHIVGHSMGGQVALRFAIEWPDAVQTLSLIAPAGLEVFTATEGAFLKAFFSPERVRDSDEATVKASTALNFRRWDERFEWIVSDRLSVRESPDFDAYCQAVSASVAAMVDHPVRADMGSINAPTLVIFGADDALIPNRALHVGSTEALAREAVAEMPDARMVMIPEAGHLVILERPKEVNDALVGFIGAH